MRLKLESETGYTATAGIATNKLLCKLVGNMHKPNSQTTLLPPCTSADGNNNDHVMSFLDDFEIGKIPGIGYKIAQKLRAHVLPECADADSGHDVTQQDLRVHQVRHYPGMCPSVLENILGGPGAPYGIGARIWGLLNGCDDTHVGQAREIPRQVSIEDSYRRLDTMDGVVKQLRLLVRSLLNRMHTDLVQDDDDDEGAGNHVAVAGSDQVTGRRWVAHPKTLRLSTRPRAACNAHGGRDRSFARISKSAPMPSFVFSFKDDVSTVAERLVKETLIPLFRQLHPHKGGWDLSLINVAATNMVDAASEKGGSGRDIGRMFRRQDTTLKQRQIAQKPEAAETQAERAVPRLLRSNTGSEDTPTPSQEANADVDYWESDEGAEDMAETDWYCCDECGAGMPLFAMGAHERWHVHGELVQL
jgi:DNA polymerase iota